LNVLSTIKLEHCADCHNKLIKLSLTGNYFQHFHLQTAKQFSNWINTEALAFKYSLIPHLSSNIHEKAKYK